MHGFIEFNGIHFAGVHRFAKRFQSSEMYAVTKIKINSTFSKGLYNSLLRLIFNNFTVNLVARSILINCC